MTLPPRRRTPPLLRLAIHVGPRRSHLPLLSALAIAATLAILLWHKGRGADPVTEDEAPGASDPPRRSIERRTHRPPAVGEHISGVVVDADGLGVEGATVLSLRRRSALPGAQSGFPHSRTARTGFGGAFRIERLLPGTYTLVASAPGFTGAMRDGLDLADGAELENVQLRLFPVGGVLSGRILDSGGGVIPGALVRAAGYYQVPDRTHEPRSFQSLADSEGQYRLELPKGRHRLEARADGYAIGHHSIDLAGNETRDFVLEPQGRITGRVVMSGSREPVAGAQVRAFPVVAPVQTDPSGVFRFESLPPGRFRLIARKDRLRGELAEPIDIEATGLVEGIELVVSEGLTLEGIVTSATGSPVPHARITVSSPGQRAPTPFDAPRSGFSDEDGRFVVDGVLPGAYLLSVHAQGHASHSEDLAMTAPARRHIVLPRAAVVTGLVLTSTGQPAARAHVRGLVRAPKGPVISNSTLTDSHGRFVLRGLGAGDLHLSATHHVEAGRVGPELLEQGGTRDLTIRLEKGARISGRVFWDDGSPASGVRLLNIGPNLRSMQFLTETLRDGTFTAAPFAPGDVSLGTILPRKSGLEPAPELSEARLSLTLEPGEHRTGVEFVIARRK
jgi:large repetitive protein